MRLIDGGEGEHVVAAARIEEAEGDAEADVRSAADGPATEPLPDADTGEDLADGGEG